MKLSCSFLRCLVIFLLLTWLLPAPSEAADPSKFQPGDKIEYKESSYPEVWAQGVFVRATPDGKQPIIRKKPSQFFPDGFETGFQWADIRPVADRGGEQKPAAKPPQFKPGDKIMYKESNYPEVWEQGVFVRTTPDGKQPIIRKKPSQFFPDGFETGFQWADIRPITAGPADPAPGKTPAKRAAKTSPPAPPIPDAPPAPAPQAGAQLTQAEILDFLRTRLGEEPFAHPQRSEIKAELARMIKARGLAFRYETLSDFSNQLSKFGATSDITFPLGDNFGPPTQQSWLLGNWNLGKIGAAVDYTKDNRVFRQTEIGVKDVGGLTIQPDGKYIWKTDTAAGVLQGAWRPATSEEMKYQGGDGLVLLKAKSGWDWIVMQDRVTRLQGDWINIAELGTRQVRENGSRKAKAR